MKRGISTNRNVAAQIQCLTQNGIEFVFRYYSTTTTQAEKRITAAEAQAICGAGIKLAMVYEDLPTAATYFTTDRGRRDGINAHNFARSLNQPLGSAIYFTVDYDALDETIAGPIRDYFSAVNDALLEQAGSPSSRYVVGVYGSGSVCRWLKSNCAFVQYTWLAESRGWHGSRDFTDWDVKQSIATGPLCAFSKDDYETCDAQDAFGQFVLAPAGGAQNG